VKWVDDPGAQVDVRVCFPGLSIHDRDQHALNVLARVLGDGLSSRLHAQLIDKKGLAYSLSAGPEFFSDCGSFDFDVTVATDKVQHAIKEILRFAKEAQRLKPSRRELDQVRQRYRYSVDFMRDAPADLGLWFGRAHLFGQHEDFATAQQRFMAVKADDCLRVAKRLFSTQSPIAVAVGRAPRRVRAEVQKAVENY
jgi:predicted Zn-dependent peptidase